MKAGRTNPNQLPRPASLLGAPRINRLRFPVASHGLIALLAFTGLITAFRAPAAACFPPPAGIVGWWPGDGDANDVVGTNNGTLQGGATANTPSLAGTAFSFDGTNAYVQV